MSSIFGKLKALLEDPPPEFAFEIGSDRIAMSRTSTPFAERRIGLPQGTVVPSATKDNVVDPAAFGQAVASLVPPAAGRRKRGAALILPAAAVRLAVIEFESFPAKEEERLQLIRFRLRRTLPFDVDSAALSYQVQPGNKVVVAIAPADVVAHYEAPFRAIGLDPGFVTCSPLAVLDLPPSAGSVLAAHLSSGVLTVLAVDNGVLSLARTLELAPGADGMVTEISADLYTTLIYMEDQTGSRPGKVLLAGFGPDSDAIASRLAEELELPAESLPYDNPGLAGYIASVAGVKMESAA